MSDGSTKTKVASSVLPQGPAAWRAPFFALALCASPLLNFGLANRLDRRDFAVILAVILAFFGGCVAFAALARFVGGRFDMGLVSAAAFVMCTFLFSDFSHEIGRAHV